MEKSSQVVALSSRISTLGRKGKTGFVFDVQFRRLLEKPIRGGEGGGNREAKLHQVASTERLKLGKGVTLTCENPVQKEKNVVGVLSDLGRTKESGREDALGGTSSSSPR